LHIFQICLKNCVTQIIYDSVVQFMKTNYAVQAHINLPTGGTYVCEHVPFAPVEVVHGP